MSCAPSALPHGDDIHQVAGPLAAIVLGLAVLAWITSVRLHRNGRSGWARTVEVGTGLAAILGLACAFAWLLSHTC